MTKPLVILLVTDRSDDVRVTHLLPLAQTDAFARAAFKVIANATYNEVRISFGEAITDMLASPR